MDHPEHTAENDAPPENVGYSDPWVVTEYGVFADRRTDGLGFSLLKTTTGGREYAERLLTLIQPERKYPLFLRERTVIYQPWTRVIPPAVGDE